MCEPPPPPSPHAPFLAEAEHLGRVRGDDVLVERVAVELREHEDALHHVGAERGGMLSHVTVKHVCGRRDGVVEPRAALVGIEPACAITTTWDYSKGVLFRTTLGKLL